jgi:hypothetical protein
MIKRVLFAVLVFAALVSLASAQDSNVSVDMIGIGSMSCAHWRSTKEHLLEGTVWIYGFWTGSITLLQQVIKRRRKLGGGDNGRSRKNLRSANVADISQRRLDHLYWLQEVAMPRDQRAGLAEKPAHPVGLVSRDEAGSPVQLQSVRRVDRGKLRW